MNLGIFEILIILSVAAIFLLIAGAVFAFVKSSAKPAGNLKKCPFCAELIQPEAIVCRFCNRDLA